MKRFSVIIFCMLLVIGPGNAAELQEGNVSPNGATAAGDDTQLEINKIALLTGTTEQMRVMAADILLKSQNAKAREIVLEVLKNPENADARAAVYKVLSQSRGSSDSEIPGKEQFIEPLLNTIREIKQPNFPLAAEALLIYDYNTVGVPIEALASDASLDTAVRLNAMQALKLRLDKRAPMAMIRLVDDKDSKISDAAKAILHVAGIPVGNNSIDRIRILEELKLKSKDEFLRDWVFRQDARLQQERAQVEMWKRLYRDVLQKHYAQADAAAREAILLEHLKAPESFRKLWAIDKVFKWRTRSGAKLPDSLTPVLLGLISDPDKSVRSGAAKELFQIVKIDSADVLIQQLDIEKEADVRIKLFAALGEACRTALAGEGVPDEIKAKTLTWAAKFLAESNADQVGRGADVISRLLEKNGLADKDMDKYLGLLKGRFEKEMQGDVAIKRSLLRCMRLLCANPSGCKQQARVLYKPMFDTCLEDESPLVREEAVRGLVSIDSKAALKALRGKLANDSSSNVRTRIIALAKAAGSADDLEWLYAKIEAGSDVDVVWQAVLEIFSRAEVKHLEGAYGRVAALKTGKKLTNSQWQSFLEVALAKAADRKPLRIKILQEFASFSVETGALDKARGHLARLIGLVDAKGKAAVRAQILGLELKSSRVKEASVLLSNELKARDLDESDAMVQQVNAFLATTPEGQDPRAIVHSVLKEVQVTDARPQWEKVRSLWLAADSVAPKPIPDTNSPSEPSES